MSISYRHQAEAVEVTAMEYRDHAARYASLPFGKGGIDEAALKLKHMRVEALFAAADTLYRVAEKDEARRAAEQRSAAE